MGDPDRTDSNVHDPGTPLLQLFDFLQEQLVFRSTPEDAQRRRRLLAVGLAAAAGLLWWRRRRDD
jgi:MYXO-CTERM domain-containing protein